MEEKIWLPKDRFWEEAKSDVSCEEGCCWHFWHSNWKNPVTGKQEVPIRLEQKVRFSTTKKQNLNITSHFSQLVPLFFHLKKIEQTTPINVNELINQYAASIVVVVPDVNNKSMENAASQLQKNISQEENVKNKKKDLEQDQLFFFLNKTIVAKIRPRKCPSSCERKDETRSSKRRIISTTAKGKDQRKKKGGGDEIYFFFVGRFCFFCFVAFLFFFVAFLFFL